MADSKSSDLSIYRMQNALETLDTAKLCLDNKKYKDTINRCYYAAFYAIKAVLALEQKDFKRHKDAVAYFNQNYVATGIFQRETGKLLGRLKRKRESSDYDDFFIASYDEAMEQYEATEIIVTDVRNYLHEKGILVKI